MSERATKGERRKLPDRRHGEHYHHHHVGAAVRFSPAGIRHELAAVRGFNAKLAVAITGAVGTMACAYLFALIALISLPAAIATGQTIVIIAWLAQTFLQLVLLSIIMVGQRVQAAAADARAVKHFDETDRILQLLAELAAKKEKRK